MLLTKVVVRNFKGLSDVTLQNAGRVNVIVGKNNSGKSSILHAIDMAGLSLSINQWNNFQPKLEVKDLFNDAGNFSIDLSYEDNSMVTVKTNPQFGPEILPVPNERQKFRSVLIWPDTGMGLLQRAHRTPRWTIQQIENRSFSNVSSLQLLFAIKHYAMRNERGMTPETYNDIINEIKRFFPDIVDIESDRTEEDIATLTYKEYDRRLDILYSGSGLRHFVDVLLKITISNANVILLDEPEMGLHPDLQRQFIDYINKLAMEKNLQFFLASHSPIFLNYADTVNYHRIINIKGVRSLIPIPKEAIHTLMGDMGVRPSDLFNHDICILVEGRDDVIFFEHIVKNLYSDEFRNLAIAVVQYAGSAAKPIVDGSISVSNIVPAQKYTFWFHDRDTKHDEEPSDAASAFARALADQGLDCHILDQREIEFYYPKEVVIAAQNGNSAKEEAATAILEGDQSDKFRRLAKVNNVIVPRGAKMRQLLNEHMTDKSQIHEEIREIFEGTIATWGKEILG